MKRLYDHIASELNPISEDKLHERYDEMLDMDGAVAVGGLHFYPSKILSECDPIAYRCGYSDWLDSCRDEYVEFNGDVYDRKEFEEAVESLIDEIESEISDAENELDDANESEVERISLVISELKADIATIEKETNL